MTLTPSNYFSTEAETDFLSVSQYNNFVGTVFKTGCEAATMAVLRGEWKTTPNTAMLIGSYVDAYFDGNLNEFKQNNPAIFTLKGDLRADFTKAEEIIKVAEADEVFMQAIVGKGKGQVIVTGNIGGYLWKGKIDRLHEDSIVDLKVVASIRDMIWSPSEKGKVTFIEAYGYVNQGAVYQELVFQMTGKRLPFFIAAITKEAYPDKEIIHIPDSTLENALAEIIERVPVIAQIKSGVLPAGRCDRCDYCRSTKKLESPIDLYSLYT